VNVKLNVQMITTSSSPWAWAMANRQSSEPHVTALPLVWACWIWLNTQLELLTIVIVLLIKIKTSTWLCLGLM